MTIMDQLTTEQRGALEAYAEKYGPGWKDLLLTDWATGRDVTALGNDQGCYLRQVRNLFGPSWLATFELAK